MNLGDFNYKGYFFGLIEHAFTQKYYLILKFSHDAKVYLLIKIYTDQRWVKHFWVTKDDLQIKNSCWKAIYILFIHLQTINRSKNLGCFFYKCSKTMTSTYLIQLWKFWTSNANSQDSKAFFFGYEFHLLKKKNYPSQRKCNV